MRTGERKIERESRNTNKRVTLGGAAPASEEISDFSEDGADRAAGPAQKRPTWKS